jgi:hypothetical protein
VGASVWQTDNIHSTEERLIGYYSKKFTSAALNYTVSELELLGIVTCLHAIKYLKNGPIQIFTDHSCLIHLMNSTAELPSLRMKRLYERLSGFSFTLNYKRGCELVVADFLSRQDYYDDVDMKDPIPMALACRQKTDKPPLVATCKQPQVRVVTRSQSKAHKTQPDQPPDWTDIPEAALDPDLVKHHDQQLEDELIAQPAQTFNEESADNSMGQPSLADPNSMSNKSGLVEHNLHNPEPHLDIPEGSVIPTLTPPTPRPPEEIIGSNPPPELYQPLSHLFRPNCPLQITHKKLPRQCDLQSFIDKVKSRSLRNYSIPIPTQNIALQQRDDPYFRDIYMFLKAGVLPSHPKVARNVKSLAEDYILVNEVLFKILETNDEQQFRLLLTIPDKSAPYIIAMYHNSLWSAHFGLKKTFQQIRNKFFIPQLYEKLQRYIQSCDTCQERKVPQSSEPRHDFVPRYITHHEPFAHLHMDIKYMFPGVQGNNFILLVVDLCTRYVLAFALKRISAIDVAEIVLQKICLVYGFCTSLTTDQGREFDNKVMQYLTKSCNINRHFCTVASHESLMAERHIKTLSEVLIGKIKNYGNLWPIFVSAATYAINTAPCTLLDGLSPYEMLFARPPRDPMGLTTNVLIPEAPMAVQEYITSLKKRLELIGTTATDLHNKYQREQFIDQARQINRKPLFQCGDLVYLMMPRLSALNTNSSKIRTHYVGPLVIQSVYDDRQVTLCDLSGQPIYGLFSIKRLKRAYFKVKDKNATTVHDIAKAMAKLDDLRKEQNKTVQVNPQSLFCLRNGQTPAIDDINKYLRCVDDNRPLTNACEIPLAPYCRAKQDVNNMPAVFAAQGGQTEVYDQDEDDQPGLVEALFLDKIRYKFGYLEVLITNRKGFHEWIRVHDDSRLDLQEMIMWPVVDDSLLKPTGRINIYFQGKPDKTNNKKIDKILLANLPVSGSLLKFARGKGKTNKQISKSSNKIKRKVEFVQHKESIQ